MREILATLDQWQQHREEIAMATLVRACGSVPRPPGARFCLTRSGKMVGSVSGGCVENDVFAHALRVLDTGNPALVRYEAADEFDVSVGLSCGGSIEVFIEPFAGGEVWQALRCAIERAQPAALSIGLTPPVIAGRKLVVFEDERSVGALDAALDTPIAVAARRIMREGGTRVVSVPWHADVATVFVEAVPISRQLFIVGGTHTAMPLCRLAKVLGFRVTVVDVRAAYATPERFPDADELVSGSLDEVLLHVCPGAASVVILTHDPKFDLPALATALRAGVEYIGILGSRKNHERRTAMLRQQGFVDSELARICAPIGLDLGARTPEEIALAILAEMLAVRYGRDGGTLSEQKTPSAVLSARRR